MSDLYRLVYASKNLIQGTDEEILREVTQILEASQRNNVPVEVTGALMFNAGAFAQVLEGPQQGVEDTFERIQCDPRHGDVTVLQCGPTGARSFANWSMAYVSQSDAGRTRWDGIAGASGFDLSQLDGDAVFAMLHELVLDAEGLSPRSGVPLQRPTIARTPSPVLDVERVRSELPQPSQILQAAARSTPQVSPPPELATATAMPSAEPPASALAPPPGAALTILREALALERQCTMDLRKVLDNAHVALAVQAEVFKALVRERDLWAHRARLLADALGQEAGAVGQGLQLPSEPFKQGGAGVGVTLRATG